MIHVTVALHNGLEGIRTLYMPVLRQGVNDLMAKDSMPNEALKVVEEVAKARPDL